MVGNEPMNRIPLSLLAVAAAVAVAYVVNLRDPERDPDVPARAAGWHGAMELYGRVARWAGMRAMAAEVNYWKAVG